MKDERIQSWISTVAILILSISALIIAVYAVVSKPDNGDTKEQLDSLKSRVRTLEIKQYLNN